MQLGHFQAKQGFFRIHLQHAKENPRMVKFRSFSLRYSLNIILNEKFNPYENSQDIFSPRISASFLNFQKGGKGNLFPLFDDNTKTFNSRLLFSSTDDNTKKCNFRLLFQFLKAHIFFFLLL